MNNTEYLLIIISGEFKAESGLLNHKSLAPNTNDIWHFVATEDGTKYKCDQCPPNTSFILVNQCNWNSEIVKKLFLEVSKTAKKLIIWSHKSPICEGECLPVEIDDPLIQSKNLCLFLPFSHEYGEKIESFMQLIVTPDINYASEYEWIIQESLKKKSRANLIALSILCQGFRAEHDSSILSGIIKLKSEENRTISKDWWNPVFRGDTNFNNLPLSNELSSLRIEYKQIEHLFDAWKANQITDEHVKSVESWLESWATSC